MTPVQIALIVQFMTANAEATMIDGCDPAKADQLAVIDLRLKDLGRALQDSGLQMDGTGHWVTPNDRTYDYTVEK